MDKYGIIHCGYSNWVSIPVRPPGGYPPLCCVCVCVGVSVQAHCEICRFHWVVSLFFYYYFLNYYSSHHWYTLMIGGFIHSITLFGMVFFFSCLSCN